MAKHFFYISIKDLGAQSNSLFPFHVYVFNPYSQAHHHFLGANSPLTDQKHQLLMELTLKGGLIAILQNQKLTYLTHIDKKEEEVKSLIQPKVHDLIIKQEEREKASKYHHMTTQEVKQELTSSIEEVKKQNNFMPLIEYVREQGMCLKYTVSHTVSLANYLCEKLMTEDNFTNRVVTLTYLFTNGMGIDDEQSVGDVLCAAFFCHIGYTQFNFDLSKKPQEELAIREQTEVKKHLGLAQHLIKKTGVLISERCNNIFYQHHEKFDGSGYPEYKKSDFIDPLALLLSAATYIVEFQMGLIDGKERTLDEILTAFQNRRIPQGLNLHFGPQVNELITSLFAKGLEVAQDKDDQGDNDNKNNKDEELHNSSNTLTSEVKAAA